MSPGASPRSLERDRSTLLALFASPEVPCTKTFGVNAAGRVCKLSDYPDCFKWHAEAVSVSDVDDLAEAVAYYSGFDNAIILRGVLTPHGAAEIDAGRLITRRKAMYGQELPPIAESSHRWCMLDIDDQMLRPVDDLATDPEIAIEHAIATILPAAFQDVRCFWQLSASAGFVPGVLKVHLWFWLSEPTDNLTLKQRMVQFVDVAPFTATQPHYIVPPVCDGIPDPIPRRSGWIAGMSDEVDVSAIPVPSVTYLPPSFGGVSSGDHLADLTAILGTVGDGLLRFHAPLRDACHAYAKGVLSRQIGRNHGEFKSILRATINTASQHPGRDPASIARYQSDKYLDDLIEGAERKLMAADPYTRMRMRLKTFYNRKF